MEKNQKGVRAGEKEGLGLAAGLAANAAQVKQQAATRVTTQGVEKVFLKIAEDGGNNPNKFGNLFEAIEATKFNRDAAIKGASIRAEVTARPLDPSLRANPHAKADILFRQHSSVNARL